MKLYNVSFNLNDTNTLMIPSIPESAAQDEDKVTPRICLSDTVEHCMQAIAVGNRDIQAGAKFILREFEIPKTHSRLIKPNQLKATKRVPDALENNEYWYLSIKKCKIYQCEIIDFDYERDIAWTCLNINQVINVIYNHCKDIKLERYKNPQSAYEAFLRYTTNHKMWNLQDDVWEDLVELPYAQKTIIKDMKYKIFQ